MTVPLGGLCAVQARPRDKFNDRVHAWLADDGIYAVNIIDGPHGEFVRSYFNTLRESFKYTYLAEGNSDWRHAARSFFILIGTDKPFEPFAFANLCDVFDLHIGEVRAALLTPRPRGARQAA